MKSALTVLTFLLTTACFTCLQAEEKSESARPDTSPQQTAFESTKSSWNGFEKYDFKCAGYPAYVVVPQQSLPGNPWVWRTSFPNFHAEVDQQLVKNGFHLAYVDVVPMLGADCSLEIMDQLYELVRENWKLAHKAALEGVSRGGLHAYRYAASRPDRVACIYADTPVLDLKSWPMQSESAKGPLQDALKFYGFANLEELKAYRGNPVDLMEPIAKARIPLRHVISPNDMVVPAEQNTLEAQRRL
ncbi:MAG: alpha/beta hydrolase, partial [Planctomycetaceae bacterium]|nr:alpha/beta hydrolase [Planctomycetaceae bacterium]